MKYRFQKDMAWMIVCGLVVSLACGRVSVHAQAKAKQDRANSAFKLTAVYSLDAALDELRQVEPLAVRIVLAEEVVKLLARHKPERCRQFLDTLFEGVLNEQAKEKPAKDKAASPAELNSLLQRVIKLAASFDDKLAQSYLEKYANQEKLRSDEASATDNKNNNARDLYLRLALDLVETNPPLAVSLAARALDSTLNANILIFLNKLGRKDANQANRFFALALQSVRDRQGTDVNELLLLYTYVFSASHILFVSPQGIAYLEIPEYQASFTSHAPDSALAKAFLQTSAQLMLAPARYASGVGRLATGIYGDLAFLKVIEAQATLYLPEIVEPLAAQEIALAGGLTPENRGSLQDGLDRWDTAQRRAAQPQEKTSTVEDLLKRAENEEDADFKDQLIYRAITLLIETKKYARAQNTADKLSDKSRAEAKPFINFQIAEAEWRAGAIVRAEELTRRDEDLARRAYMLTRIAGSFVEGKQLDAPRATQLLNEIEQISPKVANEQERIAVLLGVASVYARFDDARAAELLREAYKTFNKADRFLDTAAITRRLQIGDFFYFYELYGPEFGLREVVRKQGARNFNATLSDIQILRNRATRIMALTALCSAVLTAQS